MKGRKGKLTTSPTLPVPFRGPRTKSELDREIRQADALVLKLIEGKCLRATRERPEWVERHLKRLAGDEDLRQRLVERLMTFEEDEMSLMYWMLEDRLTQERFLDVLVSCIDYQTRAAAPTPKYDFRM